MPVTIKDLEDCIAEAVRFIGAAHKALSAQKKEEEAGKYNAAAIRASMDLTRCLARLRKY
ncbi:MAG: hypothetical protein ABSG90_11770 [Dehalococcoidia bacterium]|jgi:hypothetical protein